jgi:PhnB protein
MSVTTTTHIDFHGDARAALAFYRDVFGGELRLVDHDEAFDCATSTEPSEPTGGDGLAWGRITAPNGFRLTARDVPGTSDTSVPTGFSVCVRSDDVDELTDLWDRLLVGSVELVALAPAGWAPLRGVLRDRFGVRWILDTASAHDDPASVPDASAVA